MKKLTFLFLFLITFAGGFLRLYRLSDSPPSLNWDEAALGYNAYSISQTGRDEYNVAYPIFTRSFDEYKSMVPVYLMIPSIRIFGLNELGVRFPSAFLGTLSIVLIFFIAKYFFPHGAIPLISSLLFAIEPWVILFSRTYHEANIGLFFFLLGTLFLFYSKTKPAFYALSVIPFGISMYSYNANKILVPLFVIAWGFLNKEAFKLISKRIIIVTVLIALIFIIPFIYLTFIGQTFARLGPTNIFVLWPKEGNVFYRLFLFMWDIVGRYFAYFSPPNLFLREPAEPATIVAGNSVFYAFEFIPIFVGLLYVAKNAKKYKELLVLILLAPIPAIVTWNWFQPGRVMALLSMFSILVGLGVVRIFGHLANILRKLIKPTIALPIFYLSFIVYCVISALYLFDSTQVYLPVRDNGNWQPGYRETVPAVMEVFDKYQKVVVDTPHTQPHIFYLFYGQYSPERYHQELDLEKIGTPRQSYDFGKFEFRQIDWIKDEYLANTLFVGNDQKLIDKDVYASGKVDFVKDIWDWRGLKVARLVGTK